MNEKDLPYTDTTVLLFGPHKFTALSRVPAGYLLSLLKTKRAHPKPLIEYIEKNIDVITARHQGLIKPPPIFRCPKGIYVSKKEANAFLDKIKNTSQYHKKPIRSYECAKCGYWHVTSKTVEEYEQEKLRTEAVPPKNTPN